MIILRLLIKKINSLSIIILKHIFVKNPPNVKFINIIKANKLIALPKPNIYLDSMEFSNMIIFIYLKFIM